MAGVSLMCGDCGTLLKSVEEAQEHAELTKHTNLSESTEAVLNLVCSACGKPCRSKTDSDLHTKRTGHTEFVDRTSESTKPISLEAPKPQKDVEMEESGDGSGTQQEEMVVPEVNQELLKELEEMGFPKERTICALHYSGNVSSEAAVNWIVEHENDSDIDQMPLMGELNIENHARYILSVEKKKDSFESVVMEHLRLNGAYWGLVALDIMGKLNAVDQDEVVSWVMRCQDESGGFGGNIGHDPHILYTLSAIQVLALFDKIDVLDTEKVSNYIAALQNEDGSFSGDMWGEVDTRFSYIALCSLALLHRLDKINVEAAVKYIVSCKNLDGGFGCTPGAESHAGQIFCCVGALAITGAVHHVDKDLLGWWLCERQVKSGGLNGRPEKLPDVCYSWWVLSSLIMIDRVHWIDKKKLVQFILDCQDKENGGISDRPDDAVDVFHTYFGVAGLSLLQYPGLKPIDPAYALPVDVVNRIFLHK